MTERVLVVDDDPAARGVLAEMLAAEGLAVVHAENGREALHYLRRAPEVALIVLDLLMPIVSGWEVLAELQRDVRLAGIPVIVMSEVAHDPGNRELPAVLQCAKPFRLDVFVALVRAVIGRPAASPTAPA